MGTRKERKNLPGDWPSWGAAFGRLSVRRQGLDSLSGRVLARSPNDRPTTAV